MRAKFKQAVRIAGKDFGLTMDHKPMVHEISPEVAADPHFEQFIDAGYIVEEHAGHEAAHEGETVVERLKRVARELMHGQAHLRPMKDGSTLVEGHTSLDDDKQVSATPVPPHVDAEPMVDDDAQADSQKAQEKVKEDEAARAKEQERKAKAAAHAPAPKQQRK